MGAEPGEFSLIVSEVDAAKLADASKQFAQAFGVDETIANQICKSAPIIFAQKLTKAEVKAITPVLSELSKLGLDFRVTARVAAKLPKVNWPVRPQFTVGGSGGAAGLAHDWENNAFVCPGCGASFLFRRLGKLKLAESAPAYSGNGADAAEARVTAAAPKAAAVKAAVGAFSPSPTLEGVEGVQPLAGEGESLDLPEAVEEIKLADEPAPSAPAAPDVDLSAPSSDPDDTAPASEGAEFSEATEAAAPEAAETAPAPAPEVEAPPQEEAAAAGADGGELYNVFLSKITDTSKRDKAAELIAKVKGCSQPEAKELTTRLVIPLAKNVPKAKAEDILNQFKKLKIFGRMTKVK
jgi:hypothetical protein